MSWLQPKELKRYSWKCVVLCSQIIVNMTRWSIIVYTFFYTLDVCHCGCHQWSLVTTFQSLGTNIHGLHNEDAVPWIIMQSTLNKWLLGNCRSKKDPYCFSYEQNSKSNVIVNINSVTTFFSQWEMWNSQEWYIWPLDQLGQYFHLNGLNSGFREVFFF